MMPLFSRTQKQKVFVGISGGVDSAVSAALLTRAGYDVTGVFIKIQIPGYPCPAKEDRLDAMRVAAHLNIPFIELDLSQEYQEKVLALSLKEFARGRTPNPDTLCNREIKFGMFYDFARARGADFVATGHYAQHKDGHLYVSADEAKDQTYFLYAIPREALMHTLFPIGHLSKPKVRALAEQFALPNAKRPDSQGLCFLGDLSLEALLRKEVGPTPGDVLDEDSNVIGTHVGHALYTLGQRHGFTLYTQSPVTPILYVTAKDPLANTLTVSASPLPKDARGVRVELGDCNWLGPAEEAPLMARFRYRQKLIPAEQIARSGRSATVELKEPYYMPLGQSLVLYAGSRCLGGGVIEGATLIP